jgi:uncharacterized protein
MSGHPPRVAEDDDRFYLAPSAIPGAGLGVFARVPLAAGDRFEVIGVLVSADSAADRCSAFADHHKFRVGDDVLVPLGYGGMANHSDTPNLVKVVEDDRVYLVALRPIAVGEELCHRYNDAARQRMGLM